MESIQNREHKQDEAPPLDISPMESPCVQEYPVKTSHKEASLKESSPMEIPPVEAHPEEADPRAAPPLPAWYNSQEKVLRVLRNTPKHIIIDNVQKLSKHWDTQKTHYMQWYMHAINDEMGNMRAFLLHGCIDDTLGKRERIAIIDVRLMGQAAFTTTGREATTLSLKFILEARKHVKYLYYQQAMARQLFHQYGIRMQGGYSVQLIANAIAIATRGDDVTEPADPEHVLDCIYSRIRFMHDLPDELECVMASNHSISWFATAPHAVNVQVAAYSLSFIVVLRRLNEVLCFELQEPMYDTVEAACQTDYDVLLTHRDEHQAESINKSPFALASFERMEVPKWRQDTEEAEAVETQAARDSQNAPKNGAQDKAQRKAGDDKVDDKDDDKDNDGSQKKRRRRRRRRNNKSASAATAAQAPAVPLQPTGSDINPADQGCTSGSPALPTYVAVPTAVGPLWVPRSMLQGRNIALQPCDTGPSLRYAEDIEFAPSAAATSTAGAASPEAEAASPSDAPSPLAAEHDVPRSEAAEAAEAKEATEATEATEAIWATDAVTTVEASTAEPIADAEASTAEPIVSLEVTTSKPAIDAKFTSAEPVASPEVTTPEPATTAEASAIEPVVSPEFTTAKPAAKLTYAQAIVLGAKAATGPAAPTKLETCESLKFTVQPAIAKPKASPKVIATPTAKPTKPTYTPPTVLAAKAAARAAPTELRTCEGLEVTVTKPSKRSKLAKRAATAPTTAEPTAADPPAETEPATAEPTSAAEVSAAKQAALTWASIARAGGAAEPKKQAAANVSTAERIYTIKEASSVRTKGKSTAKPKQQSTKSSSNR